MNDLRAAWSRLGFSYGGKTASSPAHLEETLAATLGELRDDPRLFLGVATWLHSYGALVDGHQLVRHLEELDPAPPSALLAALITASSSPHLKGLLSRCETLPTEEILFSVMAKKKVLRERVKAGAIPEIRRWGLLVDDLTLKPDALRPTSWVLRKNPQLQIRALLGANLRAAVFNQLLAGDSASSISQLAREMGRPYPSVHAAVGALLSGGMIQKEQRGRAVLVHVPKDVAVWLSSYPAAMTPKLRRNLAA